MGERENREAIERLWQAINQGDVGVLDDVLADDFVQEWPQSGERLTKEASIRLGENYSEMTGTSPTFTYKRMLAGGDVFVVEGTIDYGDGTPVSYVGIAEFRDGKVARMTEYFANPFEAPDWRRQWVERIG